MNEEQVPEYISALADKEISDLTKEELDFLQRMVHERPEYFGEYQLNVATKLCLAKHVKPTRCPEHTANSIKSLIDYMHRSNKASL